MNERFSFSNTCQSGGRSWRAWIVAAFVALVAAQSAHAQDAVAGKHLFNTYCTVCHTAQPGRNFVGPSLFGVVNRPSGHAPGFRYSEANRRSGLTWTVGTLDRYLTAPRQVGTGNVHELPGREGS